MSDTARDEINAGQRFAFGDNWQSFLDLVDDERIQAAEASLADKLGVIQGLRFVDVGSGSGLFSLAARNLGAEVVSFDFDPQSVACTSELRRRYRPNDEGWRVEQGSALDADYLKALGKFDVVYSWGVLHHTGDMWQALDLVGQMTEPGGRLLIGIYNDQGRASKVWMRVKRVYNDSGRIRRRTIVEAVGAYFQARSALAIRTSVAWLRGRSKDTRGRGMDRRRDLVDWVGGWPFEVATPDLVFTFYRDRGYTLQELKTCAGGLGNNEFVFVRSH